MNQFSVLSRIELRPLFSSLCPSILTWGWIHIATTTVTSHLWFSEFFMYVYVHDTHVCICICVPVCACVCLYVCMCICVCICVVVYLLMCICVYMCMYAVPWSMEVFIIILPVKWIFPFLFLGKSRITKQVCLSLTLNFLTEVQNKLVPVSSVNLKISICHEQLRSLRDGEKMNCV